ncbi:DUF397 domain-containing protein [Nocardia carnea]|uniref:DUF397 domain-containing protein n=1 Tax=Nocardia carnea TaxID=37328 RepID=UPI002458F83E|nr:DUF397 domain-containing protein [Nocardia carnea]
MGDMTWRKASRSGNNNNCVEIAFDDQHVLIRDSKYLRDPANDPETEPVITIPVLSWPTFLNVVVYGETGEGAPDLPVIERDKAGTTRLRAKDGVVLNYTPLEWEAFYAGVLAGEFDRVVLAV